MTWHARSVNRHFTAPTANALSDAAGAWPFAALTLPALASAIIGRAHFYVLVIPTTMPSAFFWMNRGFVGHSRETELAEMPQPGVVYERHHAFRLGELLETLRSTSLK